MFVGSFDGELLGETEGIADVAADGFALGDAVGDSIFPVRHSVARYFLYIKLDDGRGSSTS